jgi:adenylosuccinate lyase
MWKAYVPRLLTVLMDQVSEHQRDLTNSASMRFVMEHVAAFAYAIHRLSMTLDGVEPDVVRMREVLEGGKDPITAEPLYVLLAMHGHPDAHEKARVLARDARQQKRPLSQLLREDASIASHLAKMTPEQLAVLDDPAGYLGAAEQRTLSICAEWDRKLVQLKM